MRRAINIGSGLAFGMGIGFGMISGQVTLGTVCFILAGMGWLGLAVHDHHAKEKDE